MSNPERVIEFLGSIPGQACCDECLARKTKIRPASKVKDACKGLIKDGRIERAKGKCPIGNHTRVLNTLASPRLSIQEAWRYVDRLCRALWVKHIDPDPPSSLAELITMLRDRNFMPAHEANMMHTIRSLRNTVVHEDHDFGDAETTIARAAWEIVRTWAERREAEAWRLTLRMCA